MCHPKFLRYYPLATELAEKTRVRWSVQPKHSGQPRATEAGLAPETGQSGKQAAHCLSGCLSVTIFRLCGQTNYMNEDAKYMELDPEILKAARLDPDVAEVSKAVMQALLEIRIYSSSHRGADAVETSIEALAAAGALSPETVARLANYQTRVHEIPSRISPDISVLDVVLASRTPPLRFVGFADGHAALVAVHPPPP